MSYKTPDANSRHRSVVEGGSPNSRNMGGRQRISTNRGAYHGPQGLQQRSVGRARGRGGRKVMNSLGSSGQGYPLRSRNINFQGRRGGFNPNRQVIILGAVAVLLIIILVVGISSCVRGCSSDQSSNNNGAEVNAVDSRVAAGVDEDLTNQLSGALNRGEKIQQIAANANKYSDTQLVELALSQDAAVDFVASYPDASHEASSYTDTVTKGKVPELYCWDSRWGAVDYAGHALAVSGSGPTSLAMAYMSLAGNADQTPATIATAIQNANLATGDSGMDASFVEKNLADLGLSAKSYTTSADNINVAVDANSYALIEVMANTLTDKAHWVLAVSENQDGTVFIQDPTSPEASSHAWSTSTLASSATHVFAITAASTESAS